MTQKNLNLYKMKHFLANAKNLSMTGLAVVTYEDLSEYTNEYDTNVEPDWQKDIKTESEIQSSVVEGIVALYGSYGKEHKYVMRCRDNTQIVRTHYNQYLSPQELGILVANAKEKTESLEEVSSVGLDNKTMDSVDDAIKFLITSGFTYGVDFSSHNAVDIAFSLAPDTLSTLIAEKTMTLNECSECDASDHEWYEREEKIVVSCNCKSVEKEISFKGGLLTLTSSN
tara:strand:+ start:2529 stop:3209 length:681 start_codon:yes stop_codon:yes gene_type:complete